MFLSLFATLSINKNAISINTAAYSLRNSWQKAKDLSALIRNLDHDNAAIADVIDKQLFLVVVIWRLTPLRALVGAGYRKRNSNRRMIILLSVGEKIYQLGCENIILEYGGIGYTY